MPSENTARAIVLKTRPHGESDLLVFALTEERGLMNCVAKGALKSRRRFAGCFEPFNLLEVKYFQKETSSFARIDSATILDAHAGIREDLARITSGAVVVELAYLMEAPGPGASELFALVGDTLLALDTSDAPMDLMVVYVMRLMKLAGYMVPASACATCGLGLTLGPAYYRGGFGLYCPKCASGGLRLSQGSLAFIRQAGAAEGKMAARLRLTPAMRDEMVEFIRGYAAHAASREIKSLSAKSFALIAPTRRLAPKSP